MNNFKIVLSAVDVVIISINIFIYMITSVVFGYTYITTKIINFDSVAMLTLVPVMIVTFIFYFTYSNKKIYSLKLSNKLNNSNVKELAILNNLKTLSESQFYALLFTLMNFILCFYLQYEFIIVIFKKLF